MAKKGKGKKAAQGEQKAEEQKDKLLEVDKEWFQIQIRSLEEKLERRNDRAKNLESSNKEYQERFEQLREDKADVVAFLKRALQQRTDQISELQARLEGLQHVHETDGQSYEKKIADMQQEVIVVLLKRDRISKSSLKLSSWGEQKKSWVQKIWS